jgi:hypothetical protein
MHGPKVMFTIYVVAIAAGLAYAIGVGLVGR